MASPKKASPTTTAAAEPFVSFKALGGAMVAAMPRSAVGVEMPSEGFGRADTGPLGVGSGETWAYGGVVALQAPCGVGPTEPGSDGALRIHLWRRRSLTVNR